MTKKTITNLPGSIHQRLLNLDPARTHDFTPVLRRYAFERWLYRLGKSGYAEGLVVKGAMLFVLWTGDLSRKTMDLDLLGIGNLTEAGLRRAFSKICRTKVEPDGLIFNTETMVVVPIRDEAEYHGLRAKFMAHLMGSVSSEDGEKLGSPAAPASCDKDQKFPPPCPSSAYCRNRIQ